MNAIQDMTSTLRRGSVHSCSRAGAMRLALASGPKTAAQLARAAGVDDTRRVRAILKADIDLGRIRLAATGVCRAVTYSIAEDFDGDLHEQLKAARALLIRHGYSVSLSRENNS